MTFPPAEGREILVTLISSGVDMSHPFLKDSLSSIRGRDFSTSTNLVYDTTGHGTHLAGIISSFAKFSPNFVFKKIKILPLKVSSSLGPSISLQISAAIELGLVNGTRIILLAHPILPAQRSEELERTIAKATQAGVIIISPAGDSGKSSVLLNCSMKDVICVGGADQDGKISIFSNFGASVDFLAPGNDIFSSIPSGKFEKRTGTAQSAALITAYVGALLAFKPDMKRSELYHRLAYSARERKASSSLSHFPDLGKSFFPPMRDMPFISLKEKTVIPVKEKDFAFLFDVLNLGGHQNRIVLEYSMPVNEFVVSRKTEVITFAEGMVSQKVILPVSVIGTSSKASAKLDIKLSFFGEVRTYSLQSHLAMDVTGSTLADMEGFWKKSGMLSGKSDKYIYTVDGRDIFSLFKVELNGLRKLGERQLFSDEKVLHALLKIVDADNDGMDDLFFVSAVKGSQSISIMGIDLKPKLQGIVAKADELNGQYFFLQHSFEDKKIVVPVFLNVGPVTAIDSLPGDFLEVDPDRHVYWLEPVRQGQGISFLRRTLTHARFREGVLSRLTVSTNSFIDVMHISQIPSGILILAGVKDVDGVTLSGLSLEISAITSDVKVKSIGFERPLDKNGMILPVLSSSGEFAGEILFVASPDPRKMSLSHIVSKGSGKGLGSLGEISIQSPDKFLNIPLITKTASGIRTWVQTESSLILLDEKKKASFIPLDSISLDGGWISDIVEKASSAPFINHANTTGDWLSFISEQNGIPVSLLKDSIMPRGCSFLGTSETEIFAVCSTELRMKIIKLKKP